MKRIDTFYSKFAWLINSYYISPKFCNILPKKQFSQNKIHAQFLKRQCAKFIQSWNLGSPRHAYVIAHLIFDFITFLSYFLHFFAKKSLLFPKNYFEFTFFQHGMIVFHIIFILFYDIDFSAWIMAVSQKMNKWWHFSSF